MAKYDLSKKLCQDRFKRYLATLFNKGALVELRSLENKTVSQNAYLHLILGWYGLEFGYSLDFVKRELYKKLVNSDIFILDSKNKKGEYYEDIRSTSTLTKDELSLTIDRFRDWSSKTCGFYLPEPSDLIYLREIQVELSKAEQYK